MNTRYVAIYTVALVLLGYCPGLPKMTSLATNQSVQSRKIVFKSGLDTTEEQRNWSTADWAEWVEDTNRGYCLRVKVPRGKASKSHMIKLPLDLTRYANNRLRFECMARADNVSKPQHIYNGVKYMFHCISPTQGSFYTNVKNVHGTFDWKKLSFVVTLPADITKAWLILGLQESSGTIMYDDILITEAEVSPIRPEPDPNASPAFKGHDLNRLRGVVSSNSFREEDLRVLGEDWNANLIRWQMTTRWGAGYRYEQDYNLEKYSAWLDAELLELDKVLMACRKYGILVVVDLHSPPGGRRPNHDLVLTHETKYFDKFISVWQKIAMRYKGNPNIWGYDLVNEPVQNTRPPTGQPDYLEAQVRAAKMIRSIDPDAVIIIETDFWDSALGFKYLTPVDIPNVIYQVHMYHPWQFTHQGLHGSRIGVKYPGIVGNLMCNKNSLRKHLEPVRIFQLAYNTHIYVGEFSAIRWAPDNSSFRYLKDCIDIFEEYGWDWSYHAFREWEGWSVEHGSDPKKHSPSSKPTDRKKLLLDWFAKNRKPDLLKKELLNNKLGEEREQPRVE